MIYEDFVQLAELVEVKNIFVNRTELYGSSNKEVKFKLWL